MVATTRIATNHGSFSLIRR